jgi:hypothetical protein
MLRRVDDHSLKNYHNTKIYVRHQEYGVHKIDVYCEMNLVV